LDVSGRRQKYLEIFAGLWDLRGAATQSFDNLAHVPARHALKLDPRVGPVRQSEPWFADKDMRQHENLRRSYRMARSADQN
jgi:hypothetical protein